MNDPRVIGRERCFVSINATVEVDLLGRCNSEMIAGRYYSGSGGQTDFARGAMYSEDGMGFVVLHSTTSDESLSRIVSRLCPGAPVTTMKNTVDHVVTEHGVAELRGGRSPNARRRSLRLRTRSSARSSNGMPTSSATSAHKESYVALLLAPAFLAGDFLAPALLGR